MQTDSDSTLDSRTIAPNGESSEVWFPLTSRQLSIWLELKTFGIQTGFLVGGYIRTRATFDYELFRVALSDVMVRNDALRLRIDDDEPRQRLSTCIEPRVDFVDLSMSLDPETAFKDFARRKFELPLPLGDALLFDFTICKLAANDHCLIIYAHHLIADGIVSTPE